MPISLHYEELLIYAQQHKAQLLSSAEQQALFLDTVSRSIKFIHANDIDIKPYVQKINELIANIEHVPLNEESFEVLLEKIRTIHLMGLSLSNKDNTQAWLTDKMQVAKYKLANLGQCLGIVYMATQSFFLKKMPTFNQRLNLIYHLPQDYFENEFDNPKKHIKLLIAQNNLQEAEKEQEQLNDIKAFFEGVALYSSAEKHAECFGTPVPKQLPLERSMPYILPNSLLQPKDNQPTYIRSFLGKTYTLDDVEELLTVLGNTLSDESFTLHFKDQFHIAALFYDADLKKWFHVQPDALPGEEIHTLRLLAPIIFSDFQGSKKEFCIDLYAQEKHKISIEVKLDTLKYNEGWHKKYLSNPFKEVSIHTRQAIMNVIEHQRYEWFEIQIKELEEEQIYKILLYIHDLKGSFAFKHTQLPEDTLDPLINISLQNISDTYKLLYAVSTGNIELCKTLIQKGVSPTTRALKELQYSPYLNANPRIKHPIKRLLIQHYPVQTDADIESLYIQKSNDNELIIELIKKHYEQVPEKWLLKSIEAQDHRLLAELLCEESNVTEAVLTIIIEDENFHHHLNDAISCLKSTHIPIHDAELLNKFFLISSVSSQTLIGLIHNNQLPDKETISQVLIQRKTSMEKGIHSSNDKLMCQKLIDELEQAQCLIGSNLSLYFLGR